MMNRQKYMKLIKKYLTCDKTRKQEICKELETDIDESLENGECWNDIVERLGNPKDIANEFNDNLGLSHKSYKKPMIISIIIGVIGFIVVGVFYLKSAEIKSQPLGTSKIFEQSQVEAMSLKVIEFVHNDQFDELYKISNDVMKKAMTKEKIKEAISQFGELGEFQRITKQEYLEFVQKGQTTLTGDIVALYGKRSVIYRISFDNEMKLSGLYMR